MQTPTGTGIDTETIIEIERDLMSTTESAAQGKAAVVSLCQADGG